MTLENCQRLLQHYEDLASGKIEAPNGHQNWGDVIKNAKTRAKEMKAHIFKRTGGKTQSLNTSKK